MQVVVLANLRWYCLSPSLYRLACPALDYPIHLAFNGEVWFLADDKRTVVVPDRETGAMLLAKQLNKDAASGS